MRYSDSRDVQSLDATDLESAVEEAREVADDAYIGMPGIWHVAVIDGDGDALADITVTVEDPPPACEDAFEHDFRPGEGGCEENPGVWGHGGGVVIMEVCRHCGLICETDTWATDPSTGEQGLETVEYRRPDEGD